ncbi:GNAT family N-acetyltransferase [Baekduia soli]|uniref:GNAT family N-acetyltransferase n=1 Tax=Baekduia soli TaxID=496014 RepID=UPI001651D291|nr:GNAT family N-acetyltransferase [Baekduia soli]
MSAPTLRTERLVLRAAGPQDVAPNRDMCADPEVQRFLGGPVGPHEAFVNLTSHAGHWAVRGYGQWIVRRASDDAFLGRVGLYEPDGWPGLEIGWKLARHAWGAGYAEEAARAAIGWAFTALQAPRLISLIVPDNAPSARLAARLGHVAQDTVELLGTRAVRHMLERPPGDAPLALRAAGPGDGPRIAADVRAAFDRYIDFSPPGWTPPPAPDDDEADLLGRPAYRCVLAEPGGVLAGHVAWWPAVDSRLGSDDPGLAHLRRLFVHPGWWGAGLARRLLAVAVQDARAHGFERMRLTTPGGQGRARRFYEREGWRADGPPSEDEAFGMPTIQYVRDLG